MAGNELIGGVVRGVIPELWTPARAGVARPAAAALLPVRPPPRIPELVQQAVFDDIFARAARVRRQGRTPVAQIDLDFAAMRPELRTEHGLRELSAQFGIRELAQPERLRVLPRHPLSDFRAYLRETGLMDRYPELAALEGMSKDAAKRSGPYAVFNRAFWLDDLVAQDLASEGLADFVTRFEALGGKAVINTARNSGRRPATLAALDNAGIASPYVMMDRIPGKSSAEIKGIRQQELRRIGPTVVVFEDSIRNLNEIQSAIGPTFERVEMIIPRFRGPTAADPASRQVNSFVFA